MVVELGGGVLDGVIDEVAVEARPVEIDLTVTDVERLLGTGFTTEQVSGILTRLGDGRWDRPDGRDGADVSARCDPAGGPRRGGGKAPRIRSV